MTKTLNIHTLTFFGLVALLTFAISGSAVFAAHGGMYSYVNTAGQIQVVEATSATEALAMAVNIDSNSGVVEGDLRTMMSVNTSAQSEMTVPTTETPAADLRVALNGLMKEHVNLGMIALYNVIDNDDATTASVEALDENSVELAAAVGSVYGADAEAAFLTIWRDHIGFFANYATGLRTEDADLRAEAELDLMDYQQEVATFFNSALPNIERATVIAGAGEHKDLLIEAMDEYHAGDFAAAYTAQREADKQISGIANLLAKEIVIQNPNSF